MSDLRIKYRPTLIQDVWGNEHIKNIWLGLNKRQDYPKAILLYGGPGTGKTTFARIFACDIVKHNTLLGNCLWDNIQEIDATEHDCESLKKRVQVLRYYASEPIVVFIDEPQVIISKTQQMFLKTIEDNPMLHFIFATTEYEKINDALISRCTKFGLSNPPSLVIEKKLSRIAALEKILITEDALRVLIIDYSNCNPRECLGNLQRVASCDGRIDIVKVRELLSDSPER